MQTSCSQSTSIFKPFITVLLSENVIKPYSLPKTKPQTQQPSRQLCSSYLSFPKLATEDHQVWFGKRRRKAKRQGGISRHSQHDLQCHSSRNSAQCPADWSCSLQQLLNQLQQRFWGRMCVCVNSHPDSVGYLSPLISSYIYFIIICAHLTPKIKHLYPSGNSNLF